MTIIYDTVTNSNYIEIVPIKVQYDDKNSATRLNAIIVSDNLLDTVVFQFKLMDENFTVYKTKVVTMSDADYYNWTGDNQTVYNYILTNEKLTAI